MIGLVTRQAELLSMIFAVSLCLCWSETLRAAENPEPGDLAKLCPQAAAEREQLLSKRREPMDVTAVTRPALRADLLQMLKVDQSARQKLVDAMKDGKDLPDDDRARQYTIQVDADNLRRIKHIVTQDGLPTISMVGADGVEAAFILIAHAGTDLPFQERMLKVFEHRLKDGEIQGGQFALLTDKVLTGQGKPQRYGTQFGDELKPEPIADEAHVDERRHALGMISLANYSCEIHALYGAAVPRR